MDMHLLVVIISVFACLFLVIRGNLCPFKILQPPLFTYSDIGEEREHCLSKRPPILCVSIPVKAEPVVAHYGEDEHENEEQEKKRHHGIQECGQESCHQYLEPSDEGHRSKNPHCTQN